MKSNKEAKLSRTHVPVGLSPADWQRGLRRQFGREQSFVLENLGSEPFFSEFRVTNPNSKSSYRVAVRGLGPGGNFCSGPDYAQMSWGLASISSSRSPNWRKSEARKRRSHAATSRSFPSSTCAMQASAACISVPGRIARRR